MFSRVEVGVLGWRKHNLNVVGLEKISNGMSSATCYSLVLQSCMEMSLQKEQVIILQNFNLLLGSIKFKLPGMVTRSV